MSNPVYADRAERLRSALRAIDGPADSGPWVEFYRRAGGGYEGLQAIARAALALVPRPAQRRDGPRAAPLARALYACPTCGAVVPSDVALDLGLGPSDLIDPPPTASRTTVDWSREA